MNANIKNNTANQQVVKSNVNLLAITAVVLVPALVLGTGLIIWNVNRNKTKDDKKNNQKPDEEDEESENQEGFVQEVNCRLDSMNLKNWKTICKNAIDKIKVWRPYDEPDFEKENNSLFEILDSKKIEKGKIEVKPGKDRIYIYVHINKSVYYRLNIDKEHWEVSRYVDFSYKTGWGD